MFLGGYYLAIVTLGFGEIVRVFMNNLSNPINVTNGPKGITLIDSFKIGSFDLGKSDVFGGLIFSGPIKYYYLLLIVLLAVIVINKRLQDSRIGRALWAKRWNEVAAALNIPIERLDDERAYAPEVMDVRGGVASLSEAERAELGDADLPAFAQVWALGFMFAVENWPEEWEAPRDKKIARIHDEALDAIVALTEDDDVETEAMEARETELMLGLGLRDPYRKAKGRLS